jgi:DNA-binding SARP family transcriptional activator/tetratricopeptide (TPR) repeat protein
MQRLTNDARNERGDNVTTANTHPTSSELQAVLHEPDRAASTLEHLGECMACRIRLSRIRRTPGPVPVSADSLQRIIKASTPLPDVLADIVSGDPGGEPQPNEIWRVGRREALLVWVRQVFEDGVVDVIPLVLDTELADRESVVIGADATPLATETAAMLSLRTYIHFGAFLNRVATLDIRKDVTEVMTAVQEGRRPAGVRVGPSIDADDDQRLEYRQALRDLLAELSPSTWLEAQDDTAHNTQPASQSTAIGENTTIPPDKSEHDFQILGQTAIRIQGRIDERWGKPRERAMLAVLLLHAGRPVSIDNLIEWVWPDGDPGPRKPIPTLHTYATRLRRSLRSADKPVQLTAANGGYRLDVDRSAIDYYRFRALLSDARIALRRGQPRQAADLAARGVQLWRGRPLDDLRSSRADNWRHGVASDDWVPANIVLLEALLELGEFNNVLVRLNALQAEHPNHLELTKLRLTALHGLGREADATAYNFAVRRQLLSDANDRAAEHLRQFHGSLSGTRSQAGMPLRAAGNIVPRQLPHDIADFVGRDELLSAISEATVTASGDPAPGVIALDGMAGVGKTALAVHWAHSARHRFPDGDFFVNLNGFSDGPSIAASTVVDDFLAALGHPPDSTMPQQSKELLLSRRLANRRTLVILDNAKDTEHIKELVTLLSSSLVIVTSRHRLTTLTAATNARRVQVEPMTATEATTLLSARLGPHQHIDDHDRTRLAQLCGGLPLAISVLAEHVLTRPATQHSEFAERLDRQELLTGAGEDDGGLANAQMLFSSSYETLAAPEQRLFRLLSLHPGPDIGVDVACAYDSRTRVETERSLDILVGAHLIEQLEAHARYRFHDLLREFAAQCAEQDETPDARKAAERRAVDYYLAAASQAHRRLHSGHVAAPGLPIDDAIEPVVFADAAQAQSWFHQERTNLTETIRFTAARGHHGHAWRLADTVAALFDRHGYYANSCMVRELAAQSARMMGDRKAEASSLIGLGMVHMILGDHAQAQQCLDMVLTFAKGNGTERGQAAILHQLGRLDLLRGDPAGAITRYRQSLDVMQRVDDQEGLCWTHCRLGEAHRMFGQPDQALMHLYQAQCFAHRIGSESAQASILIEISSVYRYRGEIRTAAGYCDQALLIVDAMPIPHLAVTTQMYTALAETNLEQGNFNAATRHAQRAVTLSQQTHNVPAEARAHDILGDIRVADGEFNDGVLAWQLAAELYDRIGITSRTAIVRAKIDAAITGASLRRHRAESKLFTSSQNATGWAVSCDQSQVLNN